MSKESDEQKVALLAQGSSQSTLPLRGRKGGGFSKSGQKQIVFDAMEAEKPMEGGCGKMWEGDSPRPC